MLGLLLHEVGLHTLPVHVELYRVVQVIMRILLGALEPKECVYLPLNGAQFLSLLMRISRNVVSVTTVPEQRARVL